MRTIIIDNSPEKIHRELKRLVNGKYPEITLFRIKAVNEIGRILESNLYKVDLIISAGGDGTINYIVNALMKSKKEKISKISLSVLPCGKANDLARILNIPKEYDKALNKILNGESKKIDLIKVNNYFVITGGGFGLPEDVIRVKNKGSILTNFKDLSYLYIVFKLCLLGYAGIKKVFVNEQEKENLMLISVMNQDFIGKRFFLNPTAKNDDGYFDMCFIKKPKRFFGDLSVIKKITKKKHVNYPWTEIMKLKETTVNLDKKYYFMGDGELLEYSNKFDISIIPRALSFIS